MSFVIGELASLFISYIGLEVDFRKNHIAVELYLARLRVSDRLKTRTYAFMTSLWSSHAGVNYDELLEEMPRLFAPLVYSMRPRSHLIGL
ncbi:hypothetical protein GQ600_25870 [Phytophthora cactorum]|nr:hypothetical protein GQ600_25870 [Phytophthora cactorum]